ncbi:hypothetical protein B9Z45_16495, partial [Limnohabitans sp. 2KL-17]|uniref:hypothetical protein n=1 Tax=Limnohabitans sp. 2KL-17 TaxID=1100704 RepID=UPI000DD1E36F
TVANLQSLGLSGITTKNLPAVLSALAAQADDGSATDSLTELQTLVTAAGKAQSVIEAYANNNDNNLTTFRAPTASDYASVGLTNLSTAQVTAINSALKTVTVVDTSSDTPSELLTIKGILDTLQAMAGNNASTDTLSKTDLALIGVVVDNVTYTSGGNSVTSDIATLASQAIKAKAGLTLPTVQEMDKWVSIYEGVMQLVATGNTGQSTLTLQQLKDFALVPAGVTDPIAKVLETITKGGNNGAPGIQNQVFTTDAALKAAIQNTFGTPISIDHRTNLKNSQFDAGFSVKAGAIVTVTFTVGGSAITLTDYFTKNTDADTGKDIYTAKAGAFTGTETVIVAATYTDNNGFTSNAAPVTLKPIDTTATTPVITAVADSNAATANTFDQGFTVTAGSVVIVKVGTSDVTNSFTKTTANGLDTYTAIANAFTGSESVTVNATLTDAAGNIATAAPVTLKPIDTTATTPVITAVADSNAATANTFDQ